MSTEENKIINIEAPIVDEVPAPEQQQPVMAPASSTQPADGLQGLSDAELEAVTGGASTSETDTSNSTSSLDPLTNGKSSLNVFHYSNPVIG